MTSADASLWPAKPQEVAGCWGTAGLCAGHLPLPGNHSDGLRPGLREPVCIDLPRLGGDRRIGIMSGE